MKNFGRIFLVEKTKNRKKKIYMKKCKKIPEKSWEIRAVSDEDGGAHPPICECELRPAHFSLGR
jgi:hypothetical protein